MQVKTVISNAIVLCTLAAFAPASYGSTLDLASGSTETTNNSGSHTINISPNSLWSPAMTGTSWVSYTQSGSTTAPGYVSPADGTKVTFTDTFDIKGTPTSGSLLVMADDTTSVTLNGVLLEANAPAADNTYQACSDFVIGCTKGTVGSLSILSELHSGVNTLTFQVEQLAGSSFGLDYSAAINYNPSCDPASATPEPGTIALLGLPLIAVSLIKRKKKA